MQPTPKNNTLMALPLGAILVGAAHAQTAPAPAPEPGGETTEVVVLNPFEVRADTDKGYTATNTLGGTRINTELRDLGSAISVVTSEFLRDTGATNNSSLLQYTANTEVAGVSGNFGGVGNTSQVSERSQLLRPNSNTRVRGLDAADNTRDFFLTNVPWDSYNVERVDIQRGANAMLFGVGSPAGIINTSLNPAKFTNAYKVENRVGSYGSVRTSADFNVVLLDNELALRVSALDDQTKYQQKPAFGRDRRLYAALRFDPSFLNTDRVRTSFKANLEFGDVDSNRPRSLPPIDAITPWFMTGTATDNAGRTYENLNRQVFDPRVAWSNNGGIAKTGSANYVPWFNNAHFGQAFGASLNLLYDHDNATPLRSYAPFVSTYRGLYSKTGDVFDASFDKITGQIPGNPYSQTLGIATFSSFATGSDLAGAQFGAWHDYALTDASIYDFYNNLIDGTNKREWQNWKSLNLDFNQSFFGNRLGYDIAFNHESYRDGQESFLDGQQYQISVDINQHLMDGTANPNAGRPYVSGKGTWGNGLSFISRDALHATLTGDLRASDLFGAESVWTKILGHHQLTGLYSRDKKLEENRTFARWAMDPSWAATLGDGDTSILNRIRAVDYAIYLGPNLQDRTTASGANLGRVMVDATPAPTYQVYYFDNHWNRPTDPSAAGYVDPNAAYVFYDPLTNEATDSSQAGNPANYVGWTTTTAKVLNADAGDIDQLVYSASKDSVLVESTAANWQGYLFDSSLVMTYGIRHDTLTHLSVSAPYADAATKIVTTDYDFYDDSTRKVVYKNDTSLWSAVLHAPKALKRHLPWGTDISLFYNRSDNWNAQTTRLDIEGNDIPNATGKTKDYGILISTMDDRISLKVNWYETQVYNATLQGDGAGLGGSGIGSMLQVEAVGAGNAAVLARGIYHGKGQPWGWDYAWNDDSTGYGANPREDAGLATDAMEKAAITSWIAQLPSQQFFDNYGIPISVAALQTGDYDNAITTVTPAYLDTQGNSGDAVGNSYDGTINGVAPVATCDTTSKGVEIELTARPIDGLNLAINASKTTATRTNLSGTLVNFILRQKALMDSPAGDIRQWWAGDRTLREVWTQAVWGPYLNLTAQDGSSAPEIRPWRFNTVANYSFSTGRLKGFNVGGAYRWQQGSILGYHLQSYTDPELMIPDVAKPIKGPSEDGLDLWVGYERKLTSRINWRVQLNLRNVGDKAHLIPISAQPDGSFAQYRIADEMTWSLTNTFTF